MVTYLTVKVLHLYAGREALKGNSLAFLVMFTDRSSGIYMAEAQFDSPATAVPTPALLPGLVGVGMAAWRKCKGKCL
ncbi:MAG: PTPA-CTERM sorting domain-containing protein (plasmid) [Leptolyngbya sp. BL-A-14]